MFVFSVINRRTYTIPYTSVLKIRNSVYFRIVHVVLSMAEGVPAALPGSPTPVAAVRVIFPRIHDNPDGWGPCEVPEQFRDTPYQPFSKDDRLGKVRADQLRILVYIVCLLAG